MSTPSTSQTPSTDYSQCGENNMTVGTQSCPCPTYQDLSDNTPELAESMGLSDQCVQTASNTNTAAQASITGFSLKLLGGFHGQGSIQTMNDEMTSAGCGDFFLNVQDIVTNNSSIACTLLNASVESSITATANAEIHITTTPLTQIDQRIANNIVDNITDLAIASGNAKYTKVIEKTIKSLCGVLNVITNRTVNLTDVTLENNVNQTINQVSSLTVGQEQSLANDYSNISRASAVQSLQNTLGVRALSPNTRSIVDNKINQNFSNIITNINNIIQTNNVNVSSDGTINISAAGNIDIDSSTISNNIEIEIITQAIQKSAIGQGVDIAATIINEATSDTKSENVSKGIEDLAEALGDANAKAIEAAGVANIMSTGFILMAVFGFGALFFFVTISKGILPPFGRGSNAMIGWLMGVLMIAALIFVIWWFFFRSSEDDKKENDNEEDNEEENVNNDTVPQAVLRNFKNNMNVCANI